MKLNTNSNTYTIIYAAVMVVIVAFLLAFVYQVLKPLQDKNVELDTKIHKLNALNIRNLAKSDVEDVFDKAFVESKDGYEIFTIDGQQKYLVPVKGQGLWGPIWGFIAVDDDQNTIFGADFQHESETAGLGSLITEQSFQQQFCGKKICAEGSEEAAIAVVKTGKEGGLKPENVVDAITGATLTSNGVDQMVRNGLKNWREAL